MAGQPFYVKLPEIWGVKLVGELPDWVSAKDIILEVLRRYSVDCGVGRIVEYYGPGLRRLSAMDRHVITNMGAELGATTTVFPSDEIVRQFLQSQGREDDWCELVADEDAEYDAHDQVDLSSLEPLIAMSSSPDNVRPVKEVAGEPIYQSYLGSSANPGFRVFAVPAEMLRRRKLHDDVSFNVNPTSRTLLVNLMRDGHLGSLIRAGARIHQAGCNGCIGMGQAPATDRISLRTVPRNFPGRSGTPEDKVCLVSPETATASAMKGVITDPRELDMPVPKVSKPADPFTDGKMMQPPPASDATHKVNLVKGPNTVTLPQLDPLPDELQLPVLLKLSDNVSTDEIMPTGSRVLPLRSNISKISKYLFQPIDSSYASRAATLKEEDGHAVVAGENYGQGSSREHAALAPRSLGVRVVVAKSFARIHWQNLINFSILPLTFVDQLQSEDLAAESLLHFDRLSDQLREGHVITFRAGGASCQYRAAHSLSPRQIAIVLAGGIINHVKSQREHSE